MNEHATVAEERVEPGSVGGDEAEQGEGARDEVEDQQEEAEDRAQNADGVGRQAAAPDAHQREAAEHGQDKGPVEQRSLLA